MPTVHLVCEGGKGSLDQKVLDATIAQTLNIQVLIACGGGHTSLASVAAWIKEQSRELRSNGRLSRPKAFALAVEDRDYRLRSEAEGYWTQPAPKELVWRRHEIENYLLEPSILLAAFQSFRQDVPHAWAQALPVDIDATTALLVGLAAPLFEDHAGHLLHWELHVRKKQAGDTDFGKASPPATAGAAYPGRNEWLAVLKTEAARLQRDCLAVNALPPLTASAIEARYDDILADIQRPEFSRPDGFLIDIKGKRLLRALYRQLRSVGARLAFKDFENALVHALARTYRPDFTYQPDDFKELADRLMRLGAGTVP